MPATIATDGKPCVVVLSEPGEQRPPGLGPLTEMAHVHYARHRHELAELIPEAEILLVADFRTDILAPLWPSAHRLRWVHAMSAGVDRLMFPALVASEIPVTNARGIFDTAIGEYVVAMILAFAKDLPTSIELKRHHAWRHRDTVRISGKRALVVGAGSIGRAVARLCRGVGLHVEGVATRQRDHDRDFSRIHAASHLHQALAAADYVIVATPLTAATEGLFDAEAFAAMKAGSYLINVGRGPIVQTGALLHALRHGPLEGAALDVFEEEPLPKEHPLWDLDNVILTSHMAGDFVGWREALGQQFMENFQRWRNGQELLNVVDKKKGYGSS